MPIKTEGFKASKKVDEGVCAIKESNTPEGLLEYENPSTTFSPF